MDLRFSTMNQQQPQNLQLPPEIRSMIWRDSIERQHVFIQQQYNKFNVVCHEFRQIMIPALLHVCKESRKELLCHYTLLCLEYTGSGKRRGLRSPKKSRLQSYVNFEVDTFVITGSPYIDLSAAFEAIDDSQRIQSIAFSDIDLCRALWPRLSEFLPHLSSIYILVAFCQVENEVKVYDPSEQHQYATLVHTHTKKACKWSDYLVALQDYMADSWKGPQPVPFKGIIACSGVVDPSLPEQVEFNLGKTSWNLVLKDLVEGKLETHMFDPTSRSISPHTWQHLTHSTPPHVRRLAAYSSHSTTPHAPDDLTKLKEPFMLFAMEVPTKTIAQNDVRSGIHRGVKAA